MSTGARAAFDARRARRAREAMFTASAWLLCVFAVTLVVWRRASIPSATREPPAHWPTDVSIPRDPARATIVLFAHPQCPCTRASIAQLGLALDAIGDRVSAHVVFVLPDGEPGSWLETDSWERARAIPRVQIHVDHGGRIARRFHAAVSGQTVLYDASGRLGFSGGITLARGHEGDNPGRSRLVTIARTGSASRRDSPVFGCALFDSTATGTIEEVR